MKGRYNEGEMERGMKGGITRERWRERYEGEV